jgi:hypothetical protein
MCPLHQTVLGYQKTEDETEEEHSTHGKYEKSEDNCSRKP